MAGNIVDRNTLERIRAQEKIRCPFCNQPWYMHSDPITHEERSAPACTENQLFVLLEFSRRCRARVIEIPAFLFSPWFLGANWFVVTLGFGFVADWNGRLAYFVLGVYLSF